jgi:hypothetical protein
VRGRRGGDGRRHRDCRRGRRQGLGVADVLGVRGHRRSDGAGGRARRGLKGLEGALHRHLPQAGAGGSWLRRSGTTWFGGGYEGAQSARLSRAWGASNGRAQQRSGGAPWRGAPRRGARQLGVGAQTRSPSLPLPSPTAQIPHNARSGPPHRRLATWGRPEGREEAFAGSGLPQRVLPLTRLDAGRN